MSESKGIWLTVEAPGGGLRTFGPFFGSIAHEDGAVIIRNGIEILALVPLSRLVEIYRSHDLQEA